MDLHFNLALADPYKSRSQQIRVMSEDWLKRSTPCPCCGRALLEQSPNNASVNDFFCHRCGETFELKSKKGTLGRKIRDGAYETAIARVSGNRNPNLFVLSYDQGMVRNLFIVPKFFFLPELLEKCPPLSASAQRAGWVGCNILFDKIPKQGRIAMIVNGQARKQNDVVKSYEQSRSLQTDDLSRRGWLFDVLACVNAIKTEEFCLSDLYAFTESLAKKHPENNNIQAKIRQQLQLLRDKKQLDFLGRGIYKKI